MEHRGHVLAAISLLKQLSNKVSKRCLEINFGLVIMSRESDLRANETTAGEVFKGSSSDSRHKERATEG
jgi:hypothetical protein